jgi:2'-5' RNA ligase
VSERVRLFAALDVPEAVRAALARWSEGVSGVEGVRRLAPETFHVTLCFLGWRPADEVERIGRLVTGCATPVPGLSLSDVAWLPPRRPRVLAADVGDADGRLGALQSQLAARLAEAAGYVPERRRYRPHVTVARARGLDRPPRLDPPPEVEFAGAAVTLYRSHSGRGGARYEALARAEL